MVETTLYVDLSEIKLIQSYLKSTDNSIRFKYTPSNGYELGIKRITTIYGDVHDMNGLSNYMASDEYRKCMKKSPKGNVFIRFLNYIGLLK